MDKILNELYYHMIFKRKSFHIFRGENTLSQSELQEIEDKIKTLIPLIPDCKTAFKIVPCTETSCTRGEYCILIYSEKKENHLLSVGYMGQQLDLWLASKNIGVCWYGMGKTEEKQYMGLDFVIMLAIEKADETLFRKDYQKTKRLPLEEIWSGKNFENIVYVSRYAPSACNTQPWFLDCKENRINLYRVYRKRGMMPDAKVSFYNKIDMGIMMLFIELCLNHGDHSFSRKLLPEMTCETGFMYNVNGKDVPRQFLRRCVANKLGMPEKANWIEYPGTEFFENTISKLKPVMERIYKQKTDK